MRRRYKPTGPDKATVQLIWGRAGGCCEKCALPLTFEDRGAPFGWSVQHRVKKSHGVDNRPCNLLVLCGGGASLCHGWVEGNPRKANELGLGLASWQDPESEPFIGRHLRPVWLDNAGRYLYLPPRQEAS
jgi:hypothetical protein